MKDKLNKHHLSRGHFIRKRLAIVFLVVLGIGLSVAVPVGISIYSQTQMAQRSN